MIFDRNIGISADIDGIFELVYGNIIRGNFFEFNNVDINNRIINRDRFVRINLTNLINKIFLDNETELRNSESDTYKLFKELTRNTTDEAVITLKLFLTSVFTNSLKINEMLNYLSSNNLNIELNNIRNYIDNLREIKKNIIKKRIETYSYNDYGNLYTFLNNNYNDKNSNLFYRVDENSNLFKEASSFLLIPKIDYLDLTNNSYKNIREAEEDYWNIISTYSSNLTYNMRIIQKTKGYLLNKNFNNLSYGIPLFLEKKSLKYEFSFESDVNNFITFILKDMYEKFSLEEIENYIDKISYGLVDYIQDNNFFFDFSEDSVQLPFLSEYINQEIAKIINIGISNIETNTIKDMKFLLNVMTVFLKVSANVNLLSLNQAVTNELNNIKGELLSVRNLLKNKGKYI